MTNDIESRLRNALTEVAATVEVGQPRPAVSPTPRRHRPRLLAAGIAAAAVVGIALSVAVLANRGDDSAPATTPATDAADDRLSYDIEVFMGVDATAADIAAVDQALRQRPDVERIAFVDKDAAYVEFSEIFWCQPDLLNATTPDALPTSFRVELVPGADRAQVESELAVIPAVDDVLVFNARTSPPPEESERADYDIEVLMTGEATDVEIAAVDQVLRQRADVERVVFVDKETAYAEFLERNRDRPDLVNASDPESFQVSFRLVLAPGTDPALLAEEIPLLPGVDTVVDPQTGMCPPRS